MYSNICLFCPSANVVFGANSLFGRYKSSRKREHRNFKDSRTLTCCSSVQYHQRIHCQLLSVKSWLDRNPSFIDSLESGTWIKLISGVDCIDCAADGAVIHSVKQGVTDALSYANRLCISLRRPLIMISVNDDEDPHFRKASFDTSSCPPNCSKPCERVCPASAIMLQSDEAGFLVPFHQGVIQNKCYGCGRCVPVCPVQNIETTSLTSCHFSVVDNLLKSEPIDAIEIHSRAESIQHFQRLWDSIEPIVQTSLSLVSISFPDGGKHLEEFLRSVDRMIVKERAKYQIIWQTDGRPMSGDIGRGTTLATVKLAKKVLHFGLRGYIQCAGGANNYTVSVLDELNLRARAGPYHKHSAVSGVAFGSFVRRKLIEMFQGTSLDYSGNVENFPCFEQIWDFVFNLTYFHSFESIVKPIKRPSTEGQIDMRTNNEFSHANWFVIMTGVDSIGFQFTTIHKLGSTKHWFQQKQTNTVNKSGLRNVLCLSKALKELQLPRRVQLVACDVDGTILNSWNEVPAANIEAIKKVMNSGIPFVLATGKARKGALNSVLEIKSDLSRHGMGVFLQGLFVTSKDGKICHEMVLDTEVALKVCELGRELGISLVGYERDRIVCETRNEETDKVIPYHEPTPESIGPWKEALFNQKTKLNKMMFMAPPLQIDQVRPYIAKVLGKCCHITQAVPGMLEVLPFGASKGEGLRRLLLSLNIDPSEVVAIGDGENDVEMFHYVVHSVAVANASPAVKAAAKHVTKRTNNNAAVAEALETLILNNPYLNSEQGRKTQTVKSTS
ncbi:Putative phosphatase [Galdieria sulphuraria]|nr:Putative phosphatase [Galdieria sulphuraria]